MTETQSDIGGQPSSPTDSEPVERPAPTFDVLPLSSELRETLAEMDYVHPTPVQIAVWEPATRGKDVVVQARTGTGKTASFGLPIVDHLVRRSVSAVQALALCPTRELALQVSAEITRLAKRKEIAVTAVYGGAPMPRQVQAIEDGAQVVVGTPGRVLDHIRRGTLPTDNVRLLVLDEADEMLSMGFERELTAILDELPKDRQTLLFSATLPPDIERIARNKLKSPEFLTLSGDHIGALEIEHYVYMVAADKRGGLLRVLEVENPESAIIFCNTKDETQAAAQFLKSHGYPAEWLNGDLPQSDREKVMAATREGRCRFLVATDVAARGIDISHLTHVINHDFPQDAESYVHRTGRTGRAGRTGTAISLITPQDIGGLYLLRLTYKIRPIEKQIPTPGELKTRAEADLITALHEGYAREGVHADDLALARRLLSHDERDAIVAGLIRDHLGARPNASRDASTTRRARTPPPSAKQEPAKRERKKSPPREPREARPTKTAVAATADAGGPISEASAPTLPRPVTTMAERTAPSGIAIPSGASAPSAGASTPDTSASEEPRPRRRRTRRTATTATGGASEEQSSSGAPRDTDGPVRHADFAGWSPPEEEGDDQPILARDPQEIRARTSRSEARISAEAAGSDAAGTGTSGRRVRRSRSSTASPADHAPEDDSAASPKRGNRATPATTPVAGRASDAEDADFVDLYVNVGRRDGARAADLHGILDDRGSLTRADVKRVRVRDRHSFVNVRRTEVERALSALNGAELGEKNLIAEIARERKPAGEANQDDAEGAAPTDRSNG